MYWSLFLLFRRTLHRPLETRKTFCLSFLGRRKSKREKGQTKLFLSTLGFIDHVGICVERAWAERQTDRRESSWQRIKASRRLADYQAKEKMVARTLAVELVVMPIWYTAPSSF